jgi:hypothetical protein
VSFVMFYIGSGIISVSLLLIVMLVRWFWGSEYFPGWLSIHRKEQWDLQCVPLVCVHWRTLNSSTRIFCVWRYGIQITPYWRVSADKPNEHGAE